MYINMEKRTFGDIRRKILEALSEEKETINNISKKAKINWRTVESHLTYLMGRGLVTEVFSSEYVRIFDITPEGEEIVKTINDDENYDRRVMRVIRSNMFTAKKEAK